MKRLACALLGSFLLVASNGCCCLWPHGQYGGGYQGGGACGSCNTCPTGGCSPYGPGAYATGTTMTGSLPGNTYAIAPTPAVTASVNPLPTY
jgi:hypothetical protein